MPIDKPAAAAPPDDAVLPPARMIRPQVAWHHVATGDYTARILVRQWLPESGSGPLLVAIHGLTGTGLDFEFLALHLAAAGWRVVAPDLPGHGRSSQFGKYEAYGLSNVSRVLSAVFEIYAGDDRTVSILGASWGGGAVALNLGATQRPLRALIVNDVALDYDEYLNRYSNFLRKEARRRFDYANEASKQLIARNRVLFHQHDDARIDRETMRRYLQSRIGKTAGGKYRFNYDPAFIAPGTLTGGNYPDYYRIIGSIAAERIMLMFGEHSPFRACDTALRLSAERTNIDYVEIADAGHAPRLMTTNEVRIVRDFLEGTRAT